MEGWRLRKCPSIVCGLPPEVDAINEWLPVLGSSCREGQSLRPIPTRCQQLKRIDSSPCPHSKVPFRPRPKSCTTSLRLTLSPRLPEARCSSQGYVAPGPSCNELPCIYLCSIRTSKHRVRKCRRPSSKVGSMSDAPNGSLQPSYHASLHNLLLARRECLCARPQSQVNWGHDAAVRWYMYASTLHHKPQWANTECCTLAPLPVSTPPSLPHMPKWHPQLANSPGRRRGIRCGSAGGPFWDASSVAAPAAMRRPSSLAFSLYTTGVVDPGTTVLDG